MRPSIAYSAVFSVDKTTESTCRSTEKLSQRGWTRLVSNLITILGGIWADKISGKLVLGFGVTWWSATTVLTPIAARVGLPFLLVMHVFMGIGEESEEEVTDTEQAENWFSLTYAQRICGQMVSTTADIHTLFSPS